MAGKGHFFAVGIDEWRKACDLGMNPAVCLLVIARGTGRDNITSRWSAEAVFKHTGMAWRRASEAIQLLVENKVVILDKGGTRPAYKLSKPEDKDKLIWLPNALVSGAAKEVPPIARLRQAQEPKYLQAFVELYFEHDLAGDGGLPRSMLSRKASAKEFICDVAQYKVYGFTRGETQSAHFVGALAPFMSDKKQKTGSHPVWEFVGTIQQMGLIETVDYLAESDSPQSELIHALGGDSHAEEVADVLSSWELPGGYRYVGENFSYVIPLPKHMTNATVIGVFRLVYRPRTGRTSAWYARHVEACRLFAIHYGAIAGGDYSEAAPKIPMTG